MSKGGAKKKTNPSYPHLLTNQFSNDLNYPLEELEDVKKIPIYY